MTTYKARDIERLTGLAQTTLRNWRGDGFDYEQVVGADNNKDHLYSRRGLFSLAIAKQARDGGCSVNQAHRIGLFASHDVARHALDGKLNAKELAKFAWLNDDSNQWRLVEGYKAEWAIFAPNEDIFCFTNNIKYVDHFTTSDNNCSGNLAIVVSLHTLAQRLPKSLIEELCREIRKDGSHDPLKATPMDTFPRGPRFMVSSDKKEIDNE